MGKILSVLCLQVVVSQFVIKFALVFEGTTLVISPLISLMKDQVDTLVQNGISATYINSSISIGSESTNSISEARTLQITLCRA